MTDGIAFDQLNLVCADVDASVAFYRLLGIDIADSAVWRTASGAHHVQTGAGGAGVDLELDSPALSRAYNEGSGASTVVVGFRVDSSEAVDAAYARLIAAGHGSRQPPIDAFWGSRYAIVADPDGRDVGIMGPPDPALRRPPPDL